jgi:hypothetical protein
MRNIGADKKFNLPPALTLGNGFFRLGTGLACAGMADYDIERTLDEQARYAHTPDRRRYIPFVMLSLRRQTGEVFGGAGA